MKYFIEICPNFDKKPDSEWFENYCDTIVDIIDRESGYGERSFHVTFPTSEQEKEGRFFYRINITIESETHFTSVKLFQMLNPIHPLVLVNLQEYRFIRRSSDDGIYWFHEGETSYDDNSTYISPNYDFYMNGQTHYTVQYVPVAIKNMYERDKERYKGVTYMWRTTGCWDNFMKATTLDEALDEFEKHYYDMLWRSVEGAKKSLDKATNNFRDFAEYRLKKGGKLG